MFAQDADEPAKPRLQIEYDGGGTGFRPKTAIGTEDGGPELDRTDLADAPWWFAIIQYILRRHYMQYFQVLPIGTAMSILKKAEVPPIYRIGLGLRWGFIIPDRDDFSIGDFVLIMLFRQNPARFLETIEYRSTYRIWKTFGISLPAKEELEQN